MHKTTSTPPTEYTIYAYNFFENEKMGCNKWQRLSSVNKENEARMQAERLFQSQLYQKIEIKKKSFDSRSGRYVAKTHKVYEISTKRNLMTLMSILLLGFASAGLFYLKMM
jgi:hypothetical protein